MSLAGAFFSRSMRRQNRFLGSLPAEHVYAFFQLFTASLVAGVAESAGNMKEKSRRKGIPLRRLQGGAGDKRFRSGGIDKSIV
jgi:hypothetical protein